MRERTLFTPQSYNSEFFWCNLGLNLFGRIYEYKPSQILISLSFYSYYIQKFSPYLVLTIKIMILVQNRTVYALPTSVPQNQHPSYYWSIATKSSIFILNLMCLRKLTVSNGNEKKTRSCFSVLLDIKKIVYICLQHINQHNFKPSLQSIFFQGWVRVKENIKKRSSDPATSFILPLESLQIIMKKIVCIV